MADNKITEEAAAKDGRMPKEGQPPKDGERPPQTGRDSKRTVEAWQEKTGAHRAVVAGAAQMRGWQLGTKLTEKEFAEGVKAFSEKPMGGPKKTPEHSGKVLPREEQPQQ